MVEFTVAIVYTKTDFGKTETNLRVAGVEAENASAALGLMVTYLSEEMKNYTISNYVVECRKDTRPLKYSDLK